ncbi:MAG: galactosyltransferase-related protein [bacterium]|nr:galactosyltransferase-related protein [bacterium]
MKSYLPNFIKFLPWWLLKSPQRKLGITTLWRDFVGLFYWLIEQTPFKAEPTTISICVGLYNRSSVFLEHFMPSLFLCQNQHLIELSIFDCGSTDEPILLQKIQAQFKGKIVFRSEPSPFARSYAFNQAVAQSTHSTLFLCDADFSLPKELVQTVSGYTRFNSFWFPIVFYLYKNKPALYAKGNGEWMIWGGKGILAAKRRAFVELGKLDESFVTWGGEDEEFWLRCHAHGHCVIRTRERNLLHHWHPSLNAKYKKIEDLTDMGLL